MPARIIAPLSFILLLPLVAAGQLQFTVTSFNVTNAQAESTDTDYASVPNRVILKTGQNTNIAFGKKVSVRYGTDDPAKISPQQSDPQKMTDNITGFQSIFELLPGQERTQMIFDLGAFRLVNRVIISSPAKEFRLRGYSLWIGQDSLSFRRIKSVPDNDTTLTNDTFTPDTARYVLILVERMDGAPTNISTILNEVYIYSVGYLSGGMFTSKVMDMGRTVNFGKIRWWSTLGRDSEVHFQVRSGGTTTVNDTWSPWSEELADTGSLFDVYEPRRFMQYRAILYTNSLETPQLDSFSMTYDTMLVTLTARARVSPQIVEILREAIVNYEVTLTFDARSLGVDTLILQTAVPIVVIDVLLDGSPLPYVATPYPGRMAIGLGSRVTAGSRLVAQIKLTPVLLRNRIPSQIVSSGREYNPQRVDVQSTAGEENWTLLTTGVPDQIISTTVVDPNPFTPNGDGRNDETFFSFIVTNLVKERPLRLEIFDLTGRKVRTLLDTRSSARAFVEQDALRWDGRDDNGRLLPPGLYLFQIYVETDGLSPAVLTKTVTIAY